MKRIFILIIAVLLLLALTACNKGEVTEPADRDDANQSLSTAQPSAPDSDPAASDLKIEETVEIVGDKVIHTQVLDYYKIVYEYIYKGEEFDSLQVMVTYHSGDFPVSMKETYEDAGFTDIEISGSTLKASMSDPTGSTYDIYSSFTKEELKNILESD